MCNRTGLEIVAGEDPQPDRDAAPVAQRADEPR
jgi:hypothetical protein